MSFEDQLRNAANRIDYSDRDRLLRETAEKCIPNFREDCESCARLGYHRCEHTARYNDGLSHFVFAVADERYEAARAAAMASLILQNDIYIKLSEAETFQQYLRQALQRSDMGSASVSMKEEVAEYKKTGLFGSVRTVREKLGKYSFTLFMSW